MKLPNRIFFTGVPGSRWSGVAQILENRLGLNTTDRTPERTYDHGRFTGHKGAYFGRGMEFPARFSYVDRAHTGNGPRLIKSHDWSFMLNDIQYHFPEDGIFLVYREEQSSFDWWKEAGGFDITYPDYSAYKNDEEMFREICLQSKEIKNFAFDNKMELETFDADWIAKTFGVHCDDLDFSKYKDVKVAYKCLNG